MSALNVEDIIGMVSLGVLVKEMISRQKIFIQT